MLLSLLITQVTPEHLKISTPNKKKTNDFHSKVTRQKYTVRAPLLKMGFRGFHLIFFEFYASTFGIRLPPHNEYRVHTLTVNIISHPFNRF